MSNIKVMSENLANKIAAGEVIERISSVVKELVENSIDAKSKVIIVDLLNSGVDMIRVIDDGVGMDKTDAELAFKRHATSKLLKEDDLFFINTLGFRGEALPSIASVSKVDLKTSNGIDSTHIYIEGGEVKIKEDSSLRIGTTFEVRDLFYNTPARLKYLKSEATELANVTMYIERLSLSRPDISFTLTNNERKIVFTSGSNDLLKTIHEIYGYTVSKNMIELSASNDDADISGFICKPTILKSNKNHLITIVNGRVIKNSIINNSINEGYHTFKPDIKYPVVVLKIETDPTLIDVNVHPTKQDIKISKINELTNLIQNTISDDLRKTLLISNIEIKEVSNDNEIEIPFVYQEENVQTEMIFTKDETFENAKKEVVMKTDKSDNLNEEVKNLNLYPVGIALGTYIIAQNETGIYMIDQHAAQERINYEKILYALKEDKIYTTSMLIPETIELSSSEYQKIEENMSILTDLGFVIESLGINTYVVKQHPTWLINGLESESIRKIFDLIIEGKYLFDRIRFQDHLAATMACKMSVKGNEAITIEQATNLLDDLVKCSNPYNCPHGRPTIIHFTIYEIERMFKRVMN